MARMTHSIDIERPLTEVYALARQVERYPEFMPDYLSSKVIERTPEGDVVERSALVKGKLYVWKSRVTFQENEGVYFVHQEGPLHGMQVSWRFLSLDPSRTRLTITHTFQIQRKFPFLGQLLEAWYYKPNISDIAGRVVVGFKKACERQPLHHSAPQAIPV